MSRYWPGSQPPLTLIHGLSGTSWDWARTVMRFPTGLSSFAVDLPGFGDEPSMPDLALTELTQLVMEKAEERLGEAFVLVGHSYACRIGIVAADTHEASLAGLVLVDGGPEVGPGRTRARARFRDTATHYASYQDALVRLQQYYAEEPEDVFLLRMSEYLKPTANGEVRIARSSEALDGLLKAAGNEGVESLWNRWKNIRIPILIIRGEKSDMLTKEIARHMVGSNQNAHLVEIVGARHNIPSSHPAELAKAIDSFAKDVGTRH